MTNRNTTADTGEGFEQGTSRLGRLLLFFFDRESIPELINHY